MHELGPESNFNESMYFNVYDPEAGMGGFFRLGNRANEGYAEMTVCLYLPPEADGSRRSVGFMYKRPTITNNDEFNAGGLNLGGNNSANISDLFTFDTSQFTYTGGTASAASLWAIDFNTSSGAITLTAVPEPSTYGLGLGALALAAAAIRRRRQTKKA